MEKVTIPTQAVDFIVQAMNIIIQDKVSTLNPEKEAFVAIRNALDEMETKGMAFIGLSAGGQKRHQDRQSMLTEIPLAFGKYIQYLRKKGLELLSLERYLNKKTQNSSNTIISQAPLILDPVSSTQNAGTIKGNKDQLEASTDVESQLLASKSSSDLFDNLDPISFSTGYRRVTLKETKKTTFREENDKRIQHSPTFIDVEVITEDVKPLEKLQVKLEPCLQTSDSPKESSNAAKEGITDVFGNLSLI